MEIELERLARRHPLFPRAWQDEVARRAAWEGWDVRDAVYSLKEERGFVSPAPATIERLLDNERRYLDLFESDELLPESEPQQERSSAD
jgi:hypothetical protein